MSRLENVCHINVSSSTILSCHISSAAKIIDYSMMNFDSQLNADATAGGASNVGIGKQAFEDLTDLQNDEFIVSFFSRNVP